MRKALFLSLLTIALAIPLQAGERHQSYFSYDDGGTVVRQAEDGRDIDARVNLPLFSGDEVITNRRGRSEVRLSDGNVIGIDRATAVRFRSILDEYDDDDAKETVVELRYGKVAVNRTDIGGDYIRLDTNSASYVARSEGVYSVETDSNGRDRVTVFDGAVEVRTPSRSTRLREGESATVDDRGLYDVADDETNGADDFERWFLRRADKFNNRQHRYLDRRLSYWGDDLDSYGDWVMVTGIGYSWRPRGISTGWRPYYNGYWAPGRHGALVWISYEPWGWAPYHYGRWAYDAFYGWVWVPGYAYAPAWVYWMYGPNYIGWAPAGWWDCHRPYYDWAYAPYTRAGLDFGFGFYGRVRVNDIDLRPWTFLDSNTIISTRVDRAALTMDAFKQRLGREGYANVSNGPARFTREDLRDPAGAIKRRGIGNFAGSAGVGSPAADITPFIRRDADPGATIRDRVARSRGLAPSTGGSVAPIGRGSAAPIGGGNVAPVGRGGLAPIGGGRGADAPPATGTVPEGRVDRGGTTSGGGWRSTTGDRNGDNSGSTRDSGGVIRRGGSTPAPSAPSTSAPTTSAPPAWRDRGSFGRDRNNDSNDDAPRADRPSTRDRSDSWRSRQSETAPRASEPSSSAPSGSSVDRSSEGRQRSVPRRIIEGIGGPRVYPRGGDSGSSSRGDRGSSSRGDRGTSSRGDRGSSSSSGRGDRGSSAPPSRSWGNGGGGSGSSSSAPPPPPPSSSSSSGNRGDGGKIERQKD